MICFQFIVEGQSTEKVSTMDFVQVLNGNQEETIYYYENNWKFLREQAIVRNYIHSYQLLKVPGAEDFSFDIILITTYENQEQYNKREENFAELIDARGDLRLLNEKEPAMFRKILFNKENVSHLFEGGK